jgi:DNA-binding CsgD family transcriptional regulator/tetratricopeptide (TPR) repeat protein
MAGHDGVGGRLPPTLREVLLARIVAMPEPAQRVVGVAAVAGRRVEHDLLARVAAMDDSDLLEALRTAVGAQVLVTESDGGAGDSGYAFRHALLQEAAYDDLLPGERQRLHRAFAEALAERGPDSGAIPAGHWAELAYHWSAARDDRRAFEASIQAGEAAASAFAFADAQRHDERALALWSTVEGPADLAGIDRVDLLDRAGGAALLAGEGHRSVALRREAVAALGPNANPIRAGTMLERLGRALWINGESEAALEACEAAVAVMPADPPSPERARVLAGYGQILMLLDRWLDAVAMCEQAVAMARQVGARQAEGHALNSMGMALAAEGRCAEGVTALEEALRVAREVANADDIGRAYLNLGEAKFYCGETRGALDLVREAVPATDAIGITGTYGRLVRDDGTAVAFELGEWAEAHGLAEESLAIRQGTQYQQRYALSRWVPLLVARGDERAEARLEELRVLLDGFPAETQFNSPYRVAGAEAALWRSEPEVALQTIREGLAEIGGRSHWYHVRVIRMGMRAAAEVAEVARARKDPKGEQAAIRASADLWEALQPILAMTHARQHAVDAEVATIEAERRRLHREPAAALWLDAADRWQARENPYLRAYCRWQEAAARLGEGDRAGAGPALTEAHQIAVRLGARPLRTAVEALAARARMDLATKTVEARSPATGEENPFGLTRRERDVLPLLIQGRTNRQIAEALFISENTAGVHVSNILGKMGAATRTEAAGIAARLGLGSANPEEKP